MQRLRNSLRLLRWGPVGLLQSQPEVLPLSQFLLPLRLAVRPVPASAVRLALVLASSTGVQASAPGGGADPRSPARVALRRCVPAAQEDTRTAGTGRDMAIAQPMPRDLMLREPIPVMAAAARILPEATATTSTGGQGALRFANSCQSQA